MELTLSDGTTARGDVLVIANGINSALRDQRLPETRVVSTAIRGIDLYARAPFTEELLAQIPEELEDNITMMVDGKGKPLPGGRISSPSPDRSGSRRGGWCRPRSDRRLHDGECQRA